MSDTQQAENEDQGEKQASSSPLRKPGVRIALLVCGVVLLMSAAIWLVQWLTHGRYQQTTNDAYLQADQVTVASKTSGTIEAVFVADNEEVKAGQPLVKIDDSASRAQFEQAQAQAAQARADILQFQAQVAEQQAAIRQTRAQTAGAHAKWQYDVNEVERYAPLAASGAEKPEKLAQLISDRDQALATLHQDEAATDQANRKIATLLAQIDQSRAKLDEAQAKARQASVDVESSIITASIAGRIGDRSARVGSYTQPASRLMTVVPLHALYLVANYKENQIGLMRVGQPVRIKVDALDGHELYGTVQSFSPGTGAQFAVIPATNATGNFTKIVQRVPVRIEFEAGPEALRVLVPGLSVEVSVDTLGSKDDKARIHAEDHDAEQQQRRLRVEDALQPQLPRASGAGR